MKRLEAIKIITQQEIDKLSYEQRLEQLTMITRDYKANPSDWSELTEDVREEIKNHKILKKASSKRYDNVLVIWLSQDYLATCNEYLIDQLKKIHVKVRSLEGNPVRLAACPCCGYRTLEARGGNDICLVCWWEDDGQDNENADINMIGPNYLSLTRGRINYLKHGISEPKRKDLMKLKHPCIRYVKGRTFKLSKDGLTVCEPQTGWASNWDK